MRSPESSHGIDATSSTGGEKDNLEPFAEGEHVKECNEKRLTRTTHTAPRCHRAAARGNRQLLVLMQSINNDQLARAEATSKSARRSSDKVAARNYRDDGGRKSSVHCEDCSSDSQFTSYEVDSVCNDSPWPTVDPQRRFELLCLWGGWKRRLATLPTSPKELESLGSTTVLSVNPHRCSLTPLTPMAKPGVAASVDTG